MFFEMEIDSTFVAKARGVEIEVDLAAMPKASMIKIFEYGMQRIVNDACAGAKDDDEARALADKKLNNLYAGIIRASGSREGNPVAAEAMRIALKMVRTAKVFKSWMAEEGLKFVDKDAQAKLKELAKALAKREDIVAQAEKNVEALKDLDIDLEI